MTLSAMMRRARVQSVINSPTYVMPQLRVSSRERVFFWVRPADGRDTTGFAWESQLRTLSERSMNGLSSTRVCSMLG